MIMKKPIIIAAAVILALVAIFGFLRITQNHPSDFDVRSDSESSATAADKEDSETATDTESEEIALAEPESEENIDAEELDEAESEIEGGGISPEFKDFWDSYLKFMETYAPLMNNPDSEDYLKQTEKYSDYTARAAEYENSENLTDDEIRYMTDAQAKITALYADALLS